MGETNTRIQMPAMDPNTCLNYRPVCHLSFHYKTLTRLVAFLFYLPRTSVTSLPIQSGFRAHQSPTIPPKLLFYLFLSQMYVHVLVCGPWPQWDSSFAASLVWRLISILHGWPRHSASTFAAILLYLQYSLAKSYLSDSFQMVVLGDFRSKWDRAKFGVRCTTGICTWTLLYTLYTADIPLLFVKHGATGHLYSDDIQAFVQFTS